MKWGKNIMGKADATATNLNTKAFNAALKGKMW